MAKWLPQTISVGDLYQKAFCNYSEILSKSPNLERELQNMVNEAKTHQLFWPHFGKCIFSSLMAKDDKKRKK